MRFVFFGTPKFAAIILQELVKSRYKPVAVVTQPDKPIKRSKEPMATPVKEFALNHLDCPMYQPEKIREMDFLDELAQIKADLFITAAYGKLFPESVLLMPKVAAVNVHASLLPGYRGANPIRRAIMDGQQKMGVTIMHMIKEMDAGDMIKKNEFDVDPDWDFGQIEEKMAHLGGKALVEALPLIVSGKVQAQPQDERLVTFAPKLEKEECEINLDQPAQRVKNHIRALSPSPGAFVKVLAQEQPKRLKLFKVNVLDLELPVKEVLFQDQKMVIGCGAHAIEILELQLEGKKRLTIEEYLRASTAHDLKIL